MPLFTVSFEKSFNLTVEAESREEVEEALDDCDVEECGGFDADWTSDVYELKGATMLKHAKADSGAIDGEILHIDDYRKAVAKRASEREAEAVRDAAPHVPDKNQTSLPFPVEGGPQ